LRYFFRSARVELPTPTTAVDFAKKYTEEVYLRTSLNYFRILNGGGLLFRLVNIQSGEDEKTAKAIQVKRKGDIPAWLLRGELSTVETQR
jgi:hypothetical protein